MYVGLESYNDESLKLFDKAITTKDIDFVVNELARYDIRINPGLITFDPTLTMNKVKQNIELFKRINYYDAFMFTRRLVLYPNASDKIKKLFENEKYFINEDVELLYETMVRYRDQVFPFYIQLNKNIVNDEIVKEIQNFHFECFDKMYNAISSKNPSYKSILNDCISTANNYIKKLLSENNM